MKIFTALLTLLLPGISTARAAETAAATETSAQARPNIVFFLVDDMGWQDTSVQFHTQITQLNRDYHTPNMERLAAQSLLFTNAYACAICSPTRVSLMTGQNAARHGVTCWTLRKDISPDKADNAQSHHSEAPNPPPQELS